MYGGKGIGFDEPGGTGESWSQYNGEEGGKVDIQRLDLP